MNEPPQNDLLKRVLMNLIGKPNIVIKDIQIAGLVGWIGDFGKPVSINDSVKGISVRDILKHGTSTMNLSHETEFNLIRFKGVTLKVSYDRKSSSSRDDIPVLIGLKGEPLFHIDT